MSKYVVASSCDWFKRHPKSKEFSSLNIIEISKKNDLNLGYLELINPRYIFFPHWNWKVKPEIYERFECIAFHTAPLPFGRGGSPIQNLITRGIKKSPVCAFRMTDIMDGGPIYKSLEVSLHGNISEIFKRIASCIDKIIIQICRDNPHPIEQSGEVVIFERLSSSDNEILSSYSIQGIYDRIRMVDGEGYPKAYINFGGYKIELTSATLCGDEIQANIRVFYDD
ncbi:Fmt Methionyl-tRNA formyltransferase [Burkholderiaceae bacterium]